MKLLKCSLLLMASAATLLAPSFTNAATPPPPKCAYPAGAVLPPPTTIISPGCPARPASPAQAGYQFVLLLNVWSEMPIPPSTPPGTTLRGAATTTRYLPPNPTPKSYEEGTTEPSVVTSDVCLQEDGTWYSLDGSIAGAFSATGGEVSLSGNNDVIGESAVLTVLQPGVSMTGTDQQWPIDDPTADQTVSTTIWTINSPSCGGE